jgi:phage tail-like protein
MSGFENMIPGSGKNGFLDQLVANSFSLSVDQVQMGTFQTCSGLSLEFEVVQHKQTDINGRLHYVQVPGTPKFNPITLKHAMDSSTSLFDWYLKVEQGKVAEARKNATITVFGPDNSVVEEWKFKNAWPSAWKTADLDATSDAIFTEEITFVHEGVTRNRAK